MNKQHNRVICMACAVLALAGCQPRTIEPTPTPVLATAQSTRMPFAVITPDRLHNSDQFTVVGADWPPDVEVTLDLRRITPADVESINLGRVTADGQGRFRYKGIVSPAMTPGDWMFVAHGADPAQIVSIPLTIVTSVPGVAVSPMPGASATPIPAGVTASATATATLLATRTATATASATASKTPIAATPTPIIITGWRGDYWNNTVISGAPVVVRNDEVVDFDWGFGSPDPRITPDNFSARWSRRLYFNSGTYRYTLRMDDGARVWLDGVLILNAWKAGGFRQVATDVTVNKGYHDVRVEFFERTGVAVVRFNVERVIILTATPSTTASPVHTATASVTPPPLPTLTLTTPPLPTSLPATPSATAHP